MQEVNSLSNDRDCLFLNPHFFEHHIHQQTRPPKSDCRHAVREDRKNGDVSKVSYDQR
jgi:hypothetical protein